MARPRKAPIGDQTRNDAATDADMPGLPDQLIRTIDPALPKTAQVYGIIRKAIVGLLLRPGSIVNEKLICDQLGISRTPLREAILQLSAENLVMVVPNSGTFVAKIDLQSVFDGHLVRDALEMKVIRLAANRMTSQFERQLDFNLHQQARMAADLDYDEFFQLDEAFHTMICEFGTSSHIWKIVNGAKAQLDRVRRLSYPMRIKLDPILAEHVSIADGLRLRDPDAAAAAMKLHLDSVFATIRQLIVERRDYFASDAADVLNAYVSER